MSNERSSRRETKQESKCGEEKLFHNSDCVWDHQLSNTGEKWKLKWDKDNEANHSTEDDGFGLYSTKGSQNTSFADRNIRIRISTSVETPIWNIQEVAHVGF